MVFTQLRNRVFRQKSSFSAPEITCGGPLINIFFGGILHTFQKSAVLAPTFFFSEKKKHHNMPFFGQFLPSGVRRIYKKPENLMCDNAFFRNVVFSALFSDPPKPPFFVCQKDDKKSAFFKC